MDAGVMICLIAAVAQNGAIGKNGKIPWRLKSDIKRFKELTMNHTVIAGRKTHDSIIKSLGKPLPGRRTVILTKNADYKADKCDIAHSWEEARKFIKGEEKIFVIGGKEIYEMAMPYADMIYLTLVKANVEGDAFFPKLDPNKWELTERKNFEKDENNEYGYSFESFARRKEFVILKNARHDDQLDIMQRIQNEGFCPFCQEYLDKAELEPVITKGTFWSLRNNRWPYKNTKVHLLAILNRHAEKLSEILPEEWEELLTLFQWAEGEYKIQGGGIGMRFGDPLINGATVNHLHFHLLAADITDKESPSYQPVRFRMG